MNIGMLVDMAASGLGPRIALGSAADGTSFAELAARARRVASRLADAPGERVALLDLNSDAVPLTLLGAALSGKPFCPLNYRLTDAALATVAARLAPATVVAGADMAARIQGIDGITVLDRDQILEWAADPQAPQCDGSDVDPEAIAVLLFTSGTTGEPKAAVLRHRNVVSYVLASVEFGHAGADEATLVCVPPYHIAGVSAVLSNLYAGRRVLRLESFDPDNWIDLAAAEDVTHAMVVPTMLTRILDRLGAGGEPLPTLRALAYGGGPMPPTVIDRALRTLPHVEFTNAYGLTESASTVAVLGPEDHRQSAGSDDPAVRARLGSVGRPLPTVTVSIRDERGNELPPGHRGEVWIAGDQISGEYLDTGADTDGPSAGWFRTRDAGMLDADGYLFVYGRLDDVIVRGGENLSPGEIESALLEHPDVTDAGVVGIPNTQWGESVAAAVVLRAGATFNDQALRAVVQARLRSTCTPEHIEQRDELPYTESGKLLRRVLRTELADRQPAR